MKYHRTLTLVGALTGTLALAATAASAQEKLKMATIAPGTSAYLTMTTFANLVNQNQKNYNFTVDATGAATKHGIELAQGKLDYAMSSPTVHFFLKNKKAMYKKLKNHAALAKNIKLVMWFPYGQYHVVTYANSGIKTLKDLKGKKVFLGPPGGGAWAGARGWIKGATGMDVKKGDYENVKASWSSAFQGFQDRQFDVYINGGIAPYPQIEQLALTNKIRLLGLSKEEYATNKGAQGYVNGLTGRELGIIKKGTYGGNVVMDHDVYTNAASVGIVVRADISVEQVYLVTKTFWEAVKKTRASTPWLADVKLDYAVQEGGMPLHAGAQKYYEEIGIAVPKGSRTN